MPVQAELGPARVLLQAAFVLAARHQRKRSWSAATGLPKGQQLAHDHGSNARVGSSPLNKRGKNCLSYQRPAAVLALLSLVHLQTECNIFKASRKSKILPRYA